MLTEEVRMIPSITINHGKFSSTYAFDKNAVRTTKILAKQLELQLGKRVRFEMIRENDGRW